MSDSSTPQPSGETNPFRDEPGFTWYPPAPKNYTVREVKMCMSCTGNFVRDVGSHTIYCERCIAKKLAGKSEAAAVASTENRLRPKASNGNGRHRNHQ
jgi:hypothetical protein